MGLSGCPYTYVGPLEFIVVGYVIEEFNVLVPVNGVFENIVQPIIVLDSRVAKIICASPNVPACTCGSDSPYLYLEINIGDVYLGALTIVLLPNVGSSITISFPSSLNTPASRNI